MLTGIHRLWRRLDDWLDTQRPDPEYTTNILAMDGTSWTAELCRDGIPYRRMQVRSISSLLRRYE